MSITANKIDKALVTCSLCHDFFNFPKTLPCLHTFCENCLHQRCTTKKTKRRLSLRRSSKSAACPTCKEPFTSISELKTDERVKVMTTFVKSYNAKDCNNNKEKKLSRDQEHEYKNSNPKRDTYQEHSGKDMRGDIEVMPPQSDLKLMPCSYSLLGSSDDKAVSFHSKDNIDDDNEVSTVGLCYTDYSRRTLTTAHKYMAGWRANGLFGIDITDRRPPVFDTWLAVLMSPT